eukprot:5092669-Pleurochrysis_carterae.AAC.4
MHAHTRKVRARARLTRYDRSPRFLLQVLLSAWFPPRYVIEETGMLTEETDMLEVLALLPPEYAYDVNFTVASGFGAAYV